MPRYRSHKTGVVIRVPVEKAERLGEEWELVVPAPPRPARKRRAKKQS